MEGLKPNTLPNRIKLPSELALKGFETEPLHRRCRAGVRPNTCIAHSCQKAEIADILAVDWLPKSIWTKMVVLAAV
jgi:hypothetical protein